MSWHTHVDGAQSTLDERLRESSLDREQSDNRRGGAICTRDAQDWNNCRVSRMHLFVGFEQSEGFVAARCVVREILRFARDGLEVTPRMDDCVCRCVASGHPFAMKGSPLSVMLVATGAGGDRG
jgi:hypothetical protein